MYEELLELAGDSTTTAKGAEQKLDPAVVEILDKFETWLVEVDGKAESTAGSYRGMVAQAIVRVRDEHIKWTDLSTDHRSAVNAFVRFHKDTGTVPPEVLAPAPAGGPSGGPLEGGAEAEPEDEA